MVGGGQEINTGEGGIVDWFDALRNHFPDHNIRFIAVNDGVDTVTGVDETTELAPFRNVMNEFYARDISRNVRSAHNTRGRAGEPLSQPP